MSTTRTILRRAALAAVAAVLLLALAGAGQAHARDFYLIEALHSGKVLMPENHSKARGARIVQAQQGPGVGYGAQHWFPEKHVNGVYKYRNRHSKLCIHHAFWDHQPGRVLIQDLCGNDTGAKYWNEVWDGQAWRLLSTLSSQYMAVWGEATWDNAPLVQWPSFDGDHMRFRFHYAGETG